MPRRRAFEVRSLLELDLEARVSNRHLRRSKIARREEGKLVKGQVRNCDSLETMSESSTED
jgi:hypothetical protein